MQQLTNIPPSKDDRSNSLEAYIPQVEFLGIVNLQRNDAVAIRGAMCVRGEWLYDLKLWIDLKWLVE